MIAVGNGEPCPYCEGKDKFINSPDADLLGHMMEKHMEQFMGALYEREGIKPVKGGDDE